MQSVGVNLTESVGRISINGSTKTTCWKTKSTQATGLQTSIYRNSMKKLEVKNISKRFDGQPVLENISIELNQGEIVCLLGISGSGKTTLFNIISGLLPPDEGQIMLDGEDITCKSGLISYMLQKDLLLPYRTIEDNVALPLLLKGIRKKEARLQISPMFSQGTIRAIVISFAKESRISYSIK